MEIPSSDAGVVKELRVKVGDKVSKGSVIALLEAESAVAAPSAPSPAAAGALAPTAPKISSPAAAMAFGCAAVMTCAMLGLSSRRGVYSGRLRRDRTRIQTSYRRAD